MNTEPQPIPSMRRPTRGSTTLLDLTAQAAEARRARIRGWAADVAEPDSDEARLSDRRIVAAGFLEKCLRGPLPQSVDLAVYLARVSTLQHLTALGVETMSTSVLSTTVLARRARVIAVALTEIVNFIDAGVPAGGGVHLCLAVSVEDGCLVVGMGAKGDFRPVASASAMRGLALAERITLAARGTFGRGVDDDRMIIGMTFPMPSRHI